MTGAGPGAFSASSGPSASSEEDRLARERLAREARATANALLDWVGTRVDASAAAPAGSRPRQSPGPCTWCPVCALMAALRGEQPELTAHLAEQASGLLVLLRMLVATHGAGGHGPAGHPGEGRPGPPPAPFPTTPPPSWWPTAEPADHAGEPADEVPWDAPHAVFDPGPPVRRPAAGSGPAVPPEPAPAVPEAVAGEPAPEAADPRLAPAEPADPDSLPVAGRPTGRRGPRPTPRRPMTPRPAPGPTPPAPPPAPTASTSTPTTTPATPPGPARPAGRPAPSGSAARPAATPRGVQRIPVRRRPPRPC